MRTDWTRGKSPSCSICPSTMCFSGRSPSNARIAHNEVPLSRLLSTKTGGCPEDCGYCSQSTEAESGLVATKLMGVQAAAQAKDHGSSWGKNAP